MPLRLWEEATRRLALTVPGVRVLGFSTAKGSKAAILEDHDVRVLEFVPTVVHQVLNGHYQKIIRVEFHPVYDLLASSGWVTGAQLWDAIRGRELVQLPGSPVTAI